MLDSYLNAICLHRPARNAGPDAIKLWLRRIETFITAGRHSELPSIIDSMYTSLGKNGPIDIQIHDILSNLFLEDKKLDLAFSEVNKALSILPDDLDLLHRKILILLEQEKYEDVKSNLDYILKYYPEAKFLPEIAGSMGRFYREVYKTTDNISDLSAAIEAYESAFNADNLSYYCGMNAITLKLIAGNFNEAKELSEKVMGICKELSKHERVSFWIDFTLGDLALIQGNYSEALDYYSGGMGRLPNPSERQRQSAYSGIERIIDIMKADRFHLNKFKEILRLV